MTGYAEVVTSIPTILTLITKIIEILNANKRAKKKLKGTGLNKKLEELETKLREIRQFRDVLLFYTRFLPETAATHVLADKLSELIQFSSKELEDPDSPHHHHAWSTMTMMFNSVKSQKNAHIVPRRESCPIDATSEEVREINSFIRDLDNEFAKADTAVGSRNANSLLEEAQRISEISAGLKSLILRHTEQIVNSISLPAS